MLFITIPLSIYNIPIAGLNLSIDRLLLILGITLIIIINVPLNLIAFRFSVLLFISTLLSILFSDIDYELFFRYAPSWFQALMIFTISASFASYYDFSFFNKIVKWHLVIITFFTIYGIWHLYILGNMYFYYPFPSYYKDLLTDSHKLGMLGNLRLFFPFSSAPRLGFVAGFMCLFFMLDPFMSKKKKYIYSMISFLIVLVTISRGPIFAIFFSLIFVSITTKLYKKNMNLILLIIPLILFLGIMYISPELGIEHSKFSRLLNVTGDDASFEGHLNVRLRVLEMVFSNSPTNLFFGFGFGQTQKILHVSSAHSSFFTVLFEQGLFGLISMLTAYIVTIYLAVKNWLFNSDKNNYRFVVLSLYLLVIHLAYDAFTMTLLWSYNGFILGYILMLKRKNAKN